MKTIEQVNDMMLELYGVVHEDSDLKRLLCAIGVWITTNDEPLTDAALVDIVRQFDALHFRRDQE